MIDRTTTRFEEMVEPVELVFDTVGGGRLERSPAVVRPGGRLISIAGAPCDANEHEITTHYFIVEPNREQLTELTLLADDGHLHPTIDTVFPLTEARQAFERSADRAHHGKIILRILNQDGSTNQSSSQPPKKAPAVSKPPTTSCAACHGPPPPALPVQARAASSARDASTRADRGRRAHTDTKAAGERQGPMIGC